MTQEDYMQFKAYARIDGLYVGLIWIGSFVCYIYGLTSPLTSMIAMIAAISSPFYAAKRMRKYRDEVRAGVLSFGVAMAYYVSIFMYASILLALAQYVYFAVIDNGYLADTFAAMLAAPEYDALLNVYGVSRQMMNDALANLKETRAIDIAVNVFTLNIIIGVILSIPAALIIKRQKAVDK